MEDKLWGWVAWHLPRKLVYWASIRLMVYATGGQYSYREIPGITIFQALKSWDNSPPEFNSLGNEV